MSRQIQYYSKGSSNEHEFVMMPWGGEGLKKKKDRQGPHVKVDDDESEQ